MIFNAADFQSFHFVLAGNSTKERAQAFALGGCVAAIEIGTGTELWRTKLKPGFLSATSYADVTVLDHDGKVFAGSNGHLFCLDAQSAQILWHNELEGLGHNDVTLSIGGRTVQVVTKVERQNN